MRPFLIFTMLFFSASLLFSCGDDKPDDLIPEDIYLDLLVELEMAHSFFISSEDSMKVKELVAAVFEHYGITPDRFERSHLWYDADIDEQILRYRRALDRLNEETANF